RRGEGLEEQSVDLMTCSQALHWFESLDGYYREVRRVLRPGGTFAVWCFTAPKVDARVDAIVHGLFNDAELWKPWSYWRSVLESGYRELPSPLNASVRRPLQYTMSEDWNLTQLKNYLHTWPPLALAHHGVDGASSVVNAALSRLATQWGQSDRVRNIEW